MTNEKLAGEDLMRLHNEKGNICVSIIVPTHRLSPERRTDQPAVENALDKARLLLYSKYPEQEIQSLPGKMDELFQKIDFNHNEEGIGLFVSQNVQLLVQFPFKVQEKIIVGDSFELRDLLYKVNHSKPYYVLVLTGRNARLFEGKWDKLTEIKAGNFPIAYQAEYSYDQPARATSYAGHAHTKSFEKDKSAIEEIRLVQFFRAVDDALGHYLVKNIPLILAGTEKELALFENNSSHGTHFIGKVAGNYTLENLKLLPELSWPVMQSYLQREREQLVKEFEEQMGAHRAISGIQEIWETAKEGNVFKLLVEKDYHSPGFVAEDDYHLYLRPPEKPHKALYDSVDELIEMVLEKNGDVYFTDNGMLEDYGRIALITRY